MPFPQTVRRAASFDVGWQAGSTMWMLIRVSDLCNRPFRSASVSRFRDTEVIVRNPHPFDPFRPADWRYRRCESFLDLGRRPSRRWDDAATWAGWRYLMGMRCSK